MDPLSDVLSLLKPRTFGAGGFDMPGEWSVSFPRHQGFKCYAVVSGQCWLSVDRVPEAAFLQAGDCFLLPQGRPFRLASDLTLASILYTSLDREGGIASLGGGGHCFIVGGHFALSQTHSDILLGALAPIVHVREAADKAALRWSLERMREELLQRQPGSSLIAQHLAHMILVQALRQHVADGSGAGVGWLFALADQQMRAAINAVHADPAHGWTMQLLAQRAGMSRSGFALRFKQLVGDTPMEYVTRWRLLLAGDRLANTGEPVSVVSRSIGYESESAFSTAFKRVMGCSPRQYGRERQSPPLLKRSQVSRSPDRHADAAS